MRTINFVFIAAVVSLFLNFNITQAEDATSTILMGTSEKHQASTTHNIQNDPAREARRMNYSRGRMMLQHESNVEYYTPAKNLMPAEEMRPMSLIPENWEEPIETKAPERTHKAFRK